MDGAKLEDGAVLIGTIVGKGAKVGKKANLVDCVVQGGMVVDEGTEGKGETFMGFEGGGGLEDEVGSGDEVEEEERESEEAEGSGSGSDG